MYICGYSRRCFLLLRCSYFCLGNLQLGVPVSNPAWTSSKCTAIHNITIYVDDVMVTSPSQSKQTKAPMQPHLQDSLVHFNLFLGCGRKPGYPEKSSPADSTQ
ncbi:hypothetical protein AMECASPLE_038156 [Ameca splendens]|uniref:Uncharacterized protein n=1 Tax=Ameca splendens TaxID=208324 RepID=A0ABV0ZV68_9TELE